MIKSFKHRGIEKLFFSGDKSGVQEKHLKRLQMILAMLNTADYPCDMNAPGLKLHKLKGARKNQYAVSVSGNWRMTFKMQKGDVFEINYEDYH
jgi:toxin HigB-1